MSESRQRYDIRRSPGRSGTASVENIKSLSVGRWFDILIAAGIPADRLDGRGHRCPKCGGNDRFAAFPNINMRGAVHCRQCFTRGTVPSPGDGFRSRTDDTRCASPNRQPVAIQPPERATGERAMSEAKQPQPPPPSLQLTLGEAGRGDTFTVIASMADDELHRDKLDLNRADHRSRFARSIHKLIPRFKPIEIEGHGVLHR